MAYSLNEALSVVDVTTLKQCRSSLFALSTKVSMICVPGLVDDLLFLFLTLIEAEEVVSQPSDISSIYSWHKVF